MLTGEVFHADAGLEVEVKDPPKGMIPPGTQMIKPKAEPQPSKVRSLLSVRTTAKPGVLYGLDAHFKIHILSIVCNCLFPTCLIGEPY